MIRRGEIVDMKTVAGLTLMRSNAKRVMRNAE